MKTTYKFSILMPTYNDSDTITESLNSLINQTYPNWELVIINDGSNDETESVIKSYIKNNKLENKIKYIYQENSDQLNALKNGLNYISGDICYIFHSDDLLADNNTLEKINFIFEKNENIDGCIANALIQIDKDSKVVKTLPYRKYTNKKKDLPLQLINIGSNLYFDFPFLKTEIFKTKFLHNYLTWNRPFWCCIEDNDILNLKLVSEPYLKYRVYDNNYLSNPMGMINVFSGEFRTAMDLSEHYYIPLYKLQYFCYRVLKKLNLYNLYIPIYKKKKTVDKYPLVNYLIHNRFNKADIEKFKILKSLIGFYQSKSSRTIDISSYDLSKEVYFGSDLRIFNKKMVANKLSEFYNFILDEAEQGFKIVKLKKAQLKDFENICHFLSLKNITLDIIES